MRHRPIERYPHLAVISGAWRAMAVLLLAVAGAAAQTEPSMPPLDKKLDYGVAGLDVKEPPRVNQTTARTVQLLGEAMETEKSLPLRRVQLVAEIGSCELPAGAKYISEAMADSDARVRAQAAQAAVKLNESALKADLEKLLNDPDRSVRSAAIESLSAMNPARTESLPAVLHGLADANGDVVSAALRSAAGPAEASAVVQYLGGLAPTAEDDDNRLLAIEALGRIGSPDNASLVVPFIKSANVAYRVTAVRALGRMKAQSAIESIVSASGDPHPTVRREAVIAIGEITQGGARSGYAMRALADPDRSVREAAVHLLTPCPSASAATAIAAQLDDSYHPLWVASRAALISPASDEARGAIIDIASKLLDNPNPRRQEDGSYVLGCLKSAAAFDRHIQLLQIDDPATADWPLIAQAAQSLGLIGDPRAADAVVATAQSAGSTTGSVLSAAIPAQVEAMVAAGRLGDTKILPMAHSLLGGPVETTPPGPRAVSAWLVGYLTDDAGQGGMLMGILSRQMESEPTKFEATKALGNLKVQGSLDVLRTNAQSFGHSPIGAASEWSISRILGKVTLFADKPIGWKARVSIEDIE